MAKCANRGAAITSFDWLSAAQIMKGNHFQPADKVQCIVCNQTGLCETDRDGKIGDHAIAIGFTGIAIETGGKINRENISAPFLPQLIDLATGCAHRFAQRRFRAHAKQAIENYDRGAAQVASVAMAS